MATEEERPRVKLRAHMITDVGVVRDHNEDAAYIDDQEEFFVVADGMGGHAAGEVASGMAVDKVREGLEEARELIHEFASEPTDEGRKALVSVLEQSVRSAHQAVYERGVKEPDKQGMGTTLDVVLIAGAEAFVAHVGDSRTYLVRDGKAAAITTDHTVAEVLVIEGKLSLEEAQISPLRTILVNAIGVAPDVGVEMAHVRLRTGDRLLLCSDGLHDYFPMDQELYEQMEDKDPEPALNEMVDMAKSRGGHDNITGVLFVVDEAPPELPEEAASESLKDTASLAAMSNGVPEQISRDDTLPVDRKSPAEGKAEAEAEEEAETAETEEEEEGDAAGGGEEEKGGDGEDADEAAAAKGDGDEEEGDGEADDDKELRTTVPMKPLSPKKDSSEAKDEKGAKDAKDEKKGKKKKRKKRRKGKKKGDGGGDSDESDGKAHPAKGSDDEEALRDTDPNGPAAGAES